VCISTHILGTCSVNFDDPDDLRRFRVIISPGLFGFLIQYTNVPRPCLVICSVYMQMFPHLGILTSHITACN